MDLSNGYENIAKIFMVARDKTVGASSVRKWAKALAPGSVVLDLGCGPGNPVSKILVEEGLTVYGIDASPTMVAAFKRNFPACPVACEAAETSTFFDRRFDAIISWGLMFLLSPEAQALIIQKAAQALPSGGKFLFTSPSVVLEWNDALSERLSVSLGAEKYRELLSAAGFSLAGEFTDEGENYYYDAVKV